MENVSPELSLAPVPEQSQDHMDSCSQGVGEGVSQQKESSQTKIENVAEEAIEESDKSSKANSPIKKTWGFRQSTVAKREMPVEAATGASETRCAVRRSGRQAKRTDKLEEFLLTAKRGTRKSAPPSLDSGDPPSQTPTDAETASEASFDGNADTKASESPERKTRSSTRKQTLRKTRSGRQTRSSGGATVSDQGSSENEDSRDTAKNDQPQNDNEETKEEKNDSCPEDVEGTKTEESPPELDSDKKELTEEKDHHDEEHDKDMDKTTDEESEDKPSALVVKRGPLRTYVNKKKAASKNSASAKSPAPANKVVTAVKREVKPKTVQPGKTRMSHTQEDNDDENDSSTSSSSSSLDSDGGYDPNALYCICRQRHNKRFMICCDRCEEWFHGDCVGITEARGRLMERNGEDYVCPNCTAKKNQVVRPATSLLSADTEGARKAAAEKTNPGLSAAGGTVATPPSSITAGSEEKGSEDVGIKGRIEKATNPTGKKKIKIFQPQVMQQTAPPKAEQKTMVEKKAASTAEQKALPDTEQKVASNVEVKTSLVTEEQQQKADESSLPKCIGPGCESNAQPDSVYCGNDCILRHAAAAMKSITDVKEPTQKEEAQKSTPKRRASGRKKVRKTSREQSDSDEDYSPDPDEDDEDEHAEEHPPSPTTASWSSDHNYIAVTPEKTTSISATVLNKKCMYLSQGSQLSLNAHTCSPMINVAAIMLTSVYDGHTLGRT